MHWLKVLSIGNRRADLILVLRDRRMFYKRLVKNLNIMKGR